MAKDTPTARPIGSTSSADPKTGQTPAAEQNATTGTTGTTGAQTTGTTSSSEADVLEALDAIQIPGEAAAADPGGGGAAAGELPLDAEGFIERSAWIDGFKGAHEIVGCWLETWRDAADAPSTEAAAGEIYDVCRSTPALQFLIGPESEKFKSIGVIAAWAIPLAMGSAQEIRDKRRAASARPVGGQAGGQTVGQAGGQARQGDGYGV